ncbi:MAG TPA: GNAT family N-acetyltransferase [Acidobacteriota bacterium]|nr:GNAT family N-acetyltransferase [Acidobacteriota bacterium]
MTPAATFARGDRLPTLETERLRLRHLTERDVPALFAVFSDPEVMRYWSSPPQQSEAEAARLLEEIHEAFLTRRLFQWGVARREDDFVIGTATLFRWDRAHRRAEIGYAIARPSWGKGFASEAVRELIRFAFRELDLHRLEADADPRNAASLRVLERHGFRREGLLRERYHQLGEIQDAAILGLLRREWEALDG